MEIQFNKSFYSLEMLTQFPFFGYAVGLKFLFRMLNKWTST